ncbi:MAG: hypothetical protein HY962_07190 [Ignavibacteriae bacterium]|nr:hypothetical protein [Ignavibacteriota bacterium]
MAQRTPAEIAQELYINGNNFAIIYPITSASGTLTLGTPLPFEALSETSIKDPMSTGKTEYIQANLDNGVTVEAKKVTKVVDAATGAEKVGGGGDNVPTIKFTHYEASKDKLAAVKALQDDYVLVCVGLGDDAADAADVAVAVLLGKITSDIERSTKGNEMVSWPVEVQGETIAGITAGTVTTWLTTITPLGADAAITIPALTTGDVVTLATGVMLYL